MSPRLPASRFVRPDYYAAETDAYILYPWEGGRGLENVFLGQPES